MESREERLQGYKQQRDEVYRQSYAALSTRRKIGYWLMRTLGWVVPLFILGLIILPLIAKKIEVTLICIAIFVAYIFVMITIVRKSNTEPPDEDCLLATSKEDLDARIARKRKRMGLPT